MKTQHLVDEYVRKLGTYKIPTLNTKNIVKEGRNLVNNKRIGHSPHLILRRRKMVRRKCPP